MDLRRNIGALRVRLGLASGVAMRNTKVRWGMEPWLDIAGILRAGGRPGGDGCLVFDIGANVGQTVVEICRRLPLASVHAFEPMPETFRELERRVGSMASLHNVAIGQAEGVIRMQAGATSDLSCVVAEGDKDLSETVVVPVETVDSVIAGLDGDKVLVLKIDVEGHELAVLEGCRDSLACGRVGVVLAETRVGNSGEIFHTPLSSLLDRLEVHGFYFAAHYTHGIRGGMGCHHGDVLLVHGNLLVKNWLGSPVG